MSRSAGLMLAVVAVAAVGVLDGCTRQAASSSEAIQYARTLKTSEKQSAYLVSQAQAFVDAEDYQEAIETAQYVLVSVDARSQAATDLLQLAEAKLAADAQAVLGDIKKPRE